MVLLRLAGRHFSKRSEIGSPTHRHLANPNGTQSRTLAWKPNSLASSIVLVCRKRPRRSALRFSPGVPPRVERRAARGARRDDQGSGDDRSPVAPVDLSQAIIGPGMAVFSKYAAVLEADGTPMSVRTALQLINRFLAEDDFDADTQFCLHWFEQHGWEKAGSAKPTHSPVPRAPAWTA